MPELFAKKPILDAFHPMDTEDLKRLTNYAPGEYLAEHGELHAQDGLLTKEYVLHRDPGAGNSLVLPWDVPFPVRVLSVFASIGTVPATSVTVDVKNNATSMLTNGPITFPNASGNNQKATVEPTAGPGSVRLNTTQANVANGVNLNVTFTQNGAGTLVDGRVTLLCQRRFA